MTVWKTLKIEEMLQEALKNQDLTGDEDAKIYSDYVVARRSLLEEILPEIKGKLPSITDHGANHIANVLNNVHLLLGDSLDKFTGIELYCLCLSVLFHDVGNLEGREAHQRNIADIYEHVRNKNSSYLHEKSIILKVCAAHCGYSGDGSMDTLKDVDESYHLHGHKVELRKIAAILRFADELAEGPQRTSAYMQFKHKYDAKSEIYHKYASITHICIDRGNKRITITYHLQIEDLNGKINPSAEATLKELLMFTYKRIIKLDQERKYAKYYCDYLSPFSETSVQFNFWFNRQPLDIGLDPIILSDKIIPGDSGKNITDINNEYDTTKLLTKIKEKVASMEVGRE